MLRLLPTRRPQHQMCLPRKLPQLETTSRVRSAKGRARKNQKILSKTKNNSILRIRVRPPSGRQNQFMSTTTSCSKVAMWMTLVAGVAEEAAAEKARHVYLLLNMPSRSQKILLNAKLILVKPTHCRT